MTTIIKQIFQNRILFLGLLIITTMLSYLLFVPYLTAFEEPHYVAISGYMWLSKNWIVLHDSAGIYLNKPPLLFWLVNLVWYFFGLNNWIFRLLPALATLGTIVLIKAIYQTLWPRNTANTWIASTLFLGTWYNMHYVPLFLFDMPLVFFITLALWGLARLLQNKSNGLIIFIIANGLGLLTKGPVIFIYTFIPALLAPYLLNIHKSITIWFGTLLLSFVAALIIASLWLIPFFDTLYNHHLLLSIFSPILKIKHLLGHRPWWFYVIKLPLLLLPWTLWPQLYKVIWDNFTIIKRNPFLVWLGLSVLLIFILMSIMSAKSSRYLMPISIYAALILAFCLEHHHLSHIIRFNNYPLLLLLGLVAVLLMLMPLFSTSITDYYPDYTWYDSVLPGLMLLGFIIHLLFYSQTLSQSVLIQCFLMFLIVIAHAAGPERLNGQTMAINQFEKCVHKHWNHLIAYQYRYAGYWFHVDKKMLPMGMIFKNELSLMRWSQQNPTGLLILNGDTKLPRVKTVCELQIKSAPSLKRKNDSLMLDLRAVRRLRL